MSSGSPDPRRWSQFLSEALRAVRRTRALRASEVAAGMNMPPRSYEHFEASGGRLNVARIYAFAETAHSDPFAILAATLMRSPAFAARATRNKLMMTFMMSLREFDAEVGDDIDLLETSTLLAGFSEMFAKLAEEARKRRQVVDSLERSAGLWSQGDAGPPDGPDEP